MDWLIIATFLAVYAGMALGRWPGLKLDRTGIALIGAILLYLFGPVDGKTVAGFIDFPTIIVLFGLMVLSAQFAACGFYDWCAGRIAAAAIGPGRLLGLVVAVGGGLSAVLANDVVVFAMTPLLCLGLARRGLDPRPFVIALAAAANAGSAATLIGNPQNILIGQVGGLDFWEFAAVCAPPAMAGLLIVHLTVFLTWRGRWRVEASGESGPIVALDRFGLAKGVLAVLVLLALFSSPLPHVSGILAVAGALLLSRRLATRRMLGLVDWHLLVLFAGLFVVTGAFAAAGYSEAALIWLKSMGLEPGSLMVMAPLSLAGSNGIGNVPLVVLVLAAVPDLSSQSMQALALLSTLAGNLLLVGSLANIIAVERAAGVGVRIGFADHARIGIPVTIASMALAIIWLILLGHD